MKKDIKEIRKTAIEYAKTKEIEYILNYLMGELSNEEMLFHDLISFKRRYERTLRERDNNSLKGEELRNVINGLDSALLHIIEELDSIETELDFKGNTTQKIDKAIKKNENQMTHNPMLKNNKYVEKAILFITILNLIGLIIILMKL